MKNIIKYISIFILIVFSFYYTDKISTLVIYKSDLMKEIVKNKANYEIPYVNAIINGDFIVPGINGLGVNELDSYYQMKKEYLYEKERLVFYEVEPITSIENNKNLIIKQGNQAKKAVSIILDNNVDIQTYCKEQSLSINVLVDYESFEKESKFEQLNNDEDVQKLDVILNKYNLNTNICIMNVQNKEKCIESRKYLVSPSYEVDNVKIIGLEVSAGDIIYIDEDLSLSNFKILLKNIYFRDLKIVKLSELITEKRNIN